MQTCGAAARAGGCNRNQPDLKNQREQPRTQRWQISDGRGQRGVAAPAAIVQALALAAHSAPQTWPSTSSPKKKKKGEEKGEEAARATAAGPPGVLRKQKQHRSQRSRRARQHVSSVAWETQTWTICLWGFFCCVIVVHPSVTPPVERRRELQGLFLSGLTENPQQSEITTTRGFFFTTLSSVWLKLKLACLQSRQSGAEGPT